jgi:hypothetical protein
MKLSKDFDAVTCLDDFVIICHLQIIINKLHKNTIFGEPNFNLIINKSCPI